MLSVAAAIHNNTQIDRYSSVDKYAYSSIVYYFSN